MTISKSVISGMSPLNTCMYVNGIEYILKANAHLFKLLCTRD